MKSPRFWVVTVILAATAMLLVSRGDKDYVPPHEPLNAMPTSIGSWGSQDIPIDSETLAILGKGDFLSRIYRGGEQANGTATGQTVTPLLPVDLFIGYFPTQRTGQSIHSPQHCLPGAGWTFESSRYTTIHDINGKPYNVGEYIIGNGEIRQFVIYWYEAHGRSIANEYKARAYMISDAIRTNRTDGALVRVITQISPTETVETARNRALLFTSEMATYLPRFIPN